MYRISIIGSGKVAWNLAQALENAGHFIGEVWSRQSRNAAVLVDHLYDAVVQEHLDFSRSRSQIFLLAVSDAAVAELAQQLMLPPEAVLAHTSGTLSMRLLEPAATRIGVFYPLQTFSRERRVDFQEVPFCVEATDKATFKQLKKLGQSLGSRVYELDEAKRKKLHLAAVFACNFTNHMLRISEEIMQEHEMDPHMLHPLMLETLSKGMELGAGKAQTGPASRQDAEVMAAQLEQLQERPEWAELYYLISRDIIRLQKDSGEKR